MDYLNSIVDISARFKRSTNISNDLKGRTDFLKGYQFQTSEENALATMGRHLLTSNQKAFTITGPYGSGKSSLGLFICELLNEAEDIRAQAYQKITHSNERATITNAFCKHPRKILALSGFRGSLEEELNRALFEGTSNSLRENLSKFPTVTENPTLLVIDELGRFLEGGQNANCAVLQDLAEAINNNASNLLFIGILHQSFASYASTAVDMEDWARIQGRFVDLPLVADPEETLKILSSVIDCAPIFGNRTMVEKSTQIVVDFLALKKPINKKSFQSSLINSWPLNPVVSMLLGPMARRGFWQNNRSIFNFLTSSEPHAFQDFLARTSIEEADLYSPWQLWDYLISNYDSLISTDHVDGHQWALAKDCLERTVSKGDEKHAKIVKTIALISLFKAGTGLESNLQVIQASLPEIQLSDLTVRLVQLVDWKVLVERKFSDSYGLFEGSDFNFEAVPTTTSEENLSTSFLNEKVKLAPITARQHYAKTGNMRWFIIETVNKDSGESACNQIPKEASGKFLLWLDQEDPDIMSLGLRNDLPLYIGIPANRKKLYLAGQELQRLNNLSDDPSLEGDRTARIELDSRIASAHQVFISELGDALREITWKSPNRDNTTTHGVKELSAWASKLCDDTYNICPEFHNELINRSFISTNIRSAQKKLLLGMLSNENKECLGFQGFPPEAMVFISFFKQNELHLPSKRGHFAFKMPKDKENVFVKIWERTENFLKDKPSVPLDQLYDFWSKPPFGLKRGIMPMLMLFYYLTHDDLLTFYLSDVYQPKATSELIEMALAVPKSVSLRYLKNKKSNLALTSKLASLLKTYDSTLIKKDALSVARSLVQIVSELPLWSQTTSTASEKAKKLRTTVIKAWDPLNLLYEDLPTIFGTKDPEALAQSLKEELDELVNLSPQMLADFNKTFLESMDVQNTTESLKERAERIKGLSGQLQMEAFITRVHTYVGSSSDIEGLLGLATAKMRGHWSDMDIVKAKTKIAEWAFNFRHLEGLAKAGDKNSGRKLFGVVLSGSSGRKDVIFDMPAQLPKKLVEIHRQLSTLLNGLTDREALSLLIEEGLARIGKEHEQ